jgi:hypothetical protein
MLNWFVRIGTILAVATFMPMTARGAAAGAGADADALTDFLHDRPAVAAAGAARFESTAERWKSTGVSVTEGQGVTLFGFGKDVGARVWVRIGSADIVNLGEETYSFRSWSSGEIEVAAPPAGVNWERCDGKLPASAGSLPAEALDLAVVAVAWTSPPEEALAALSKQSEHEAVTRAKGDLERMRPLPAGFRSVCYLRRTNVFEAWEGDGRRGVWGNAASSAGIIKKAVDLPLDRSSEISFEWRYDALHALGPETDASHHDYSSIAVELDNGQDITWMRSPHLEAGTMFRCPLPWWDQRETHIVLSGGRDGLGEWQQHTRRILDDYEKAVGGVPPTRIVGVWFISVGIFDGTTPDTKYANVVLRSGGQTVDIFGDGL